MTFRSRKLLDLAHDMPCMCEFIHDCTQQLGVEPMHSDSHLFGRGHGHKSHDFAFAAGCHAAHEILTGSHNRDQKFFDWLRAYVKTQEYLWERGLVQVNA
jgi:hypothetical protein